MLAPVTLGSNETITQTIQLVKLLADPEAAAQRLKELQDAYKQAETKTREASVVEVTIAKQQEEAMQLVYASNKIEAEAKDLLKQAQVKVKDAELKVRNLQEEYNVLVQQIINDKQKFKDDQDMIVVKKQQLDDREQQLLKREKLADSLVKDGNDKIAEYETKLASLRKLVG